MPEVQRFDALARARPDREILSSDALRPVRRVRAQRERERVTYVCIHIYIHIYVDSYVSVCINR